MSGECFWTDLVRTREDCTVYVPPPLINILANGAYAGFGPPGNYASSGSIDYEGDTFQASVSASASIGPGQPAIVVSISCDAIDRAVPSDFCGSCSLGDKQGTATLRIKAPGTDPTWDVNETVVVFGSLYNIPFDITHITVKDGNGNVVADADTGLYYAEGYSATVDKTSDPWTYTLQAFDLTTLLNLAGGWTDFSGGSIELTLSYDGNTSSGTPLQLQGIDLTVGESCLC